MNQYVDSSETVSAMKSIKTAKNAFLLLIFLALAVQASGFILLESTDLMDTSSTAPAGELSSAAQPPDQPPATSKEQAQILREAFGWILPITKFLGAVCGVLVVISLMYAGALSLLAQGRGAKLMISAFCWSLLLLAMVIPWQQIFRGSLACGALYNLSELTTWYDSIHTAQSDMTANILYFARFLGYPGLTLLVWIVVLGKSAGGYKRLVSPEGVKPQPLSTQ